MAVTSLLQPTPAPVASATHRLPRAAGPEQPEASPTPRSAVCHSPPRCLAARASRTDRGCTTVRTTARRTSAPCRPAAGRAPRRGGRSPSPTAAAGSGVWNETGEGGEASFEVLPLLLMHTDFQKGRRWQRQTGQLRSRLRCGTHPDTWVHQTRPVVLRLSHTVASALPAVAPPAPRAP